MTKAIQILVCGACIAFLSSCTLVKPIVSALIYPATVIAERLDTGSDREPDDLPAPLAIAAFPILFPLNYVYWTAHGTVSGLFSGLANDFNLVTGNGSMKRTWDTMLEPSKTNVNLPDN